MSTLRLDFSRPHFLPSPLLIPAILLLGICFPARLLLAADDAGVVSGSSGATAIPFDMPRDGVATIGLYSNGGRLLRPLMQNVALPKGRHVVRWDGMDLFGNILPAATEVEVRVFTGPGLKAKWEFAIASPNPIPWPTRPFGEGEAMRTGGWLGDHGVSASAVAVGDRIFFGSTLAEHGHTVMFTNLEGEKMWGRGGLEGWVGPRILTSDGQAVYAVVKENHLHRLELDGSKSAVIADTKEDEISGAAASAGKVVLTIKNHEAFRPLVAPAVGGGDFQFSECLPVPENAKAYNRNLTGQEQFATTFYSGGHPQTGITPAGSGACAGIVARFKNPVRIGTLLVGRMDVPANAEIYVLKPGVQYNTSMAPKPGEVPGGAWQMFGKSDLARRVNTVTGTDEATAEALYIRLIATGAAGPEKWPRLTMCRILEKRLRRVDSGATVQIPAGVQPGEKVDGAAPGDTTWSFRTTEPLTDQTPANVVLDLKRDTMIDALVFYNCVNQSYAIDAWTGGAMAPDPAANDKWSEVTVYKAGNRGVLGASAAPLYANDQRVNFDHTVTTRALRLRIIEGMGPGRFAVPMNTAFPMRSDAGDVAVLQLEGRRPRVPEMILQVLDGATGSPVLESRDPSVAMTSIAFDPAGTLYSIVEKSFAGQRCLPHPAERCGTRSSTTAIS